jgi:hypothetical protein
MLKVTSVQIGHLLLADIIDLSPCHFANLVFVWLTRTLGDTNSQLQQRSSWRALGNELKATIIVNRYNNRNRCPLKFLGSFIELGNELPEIHTELTKRSTNRRSRGSLATGHLKLRLSYHLLCHSDLTRSSFVNQTLTSPTRTRNSNLFYLTVRPQPTKMPERILLTQPSRLHRSTKRAPLANDPIQPAYCDRIY